MEQVKKFSKAGRFANDIVDKNLMKFEKNLTINQQKVLYYLIIQEKNGQSLQGVSWNNLQGLVGIKSGERYSVARKQKFIKEMTDVKLWVYVDDKNMGSHVIFPSFELINDNLQYSINQRFPDLFNNPTVGYFIMNQELIREFKHDHSIRIYQLLNRQLGANDKSVNDFTFRYDQLKEYLNLEKTKYKGSDFKKRILDPSLNEINELTDISIKGKYNSRTKKWQLSSKFGNPEEFFIGGISRKNTVQEYVQEQFDNAIIAKEESKTKINKESKVTNTVCDIEKSNEIFKNVYGEFKHVLLSEEQYEQSLSLFADTEELNKAIQILDDYLEQNPDKQYANHLLSLRRFSKAIIEKQKVKEQYKANYYYGGEKQTYVEPTYEKYEDHEASSIEFDNMTDEEKSEILNNIYGPSTKDVDNINAVGSDEKILSINEDSVKSADPNYEGIEINEQQDIISDDILELPVGESNNKELVQLTNESIDDDELRKEALYQYLEDTLPTSMSALNMMEEPILGMLEKLYVEVEWLYFSFHDGKIDEETARKKLEEKEIRYEYKLTSEEKYKLNRIAMEKWNGIPF